MFIKLVFIHKTLLFLKNHYNLTYFVLRDFGNRHIVYKIHGYEKIF